MTANSGFPPLSNPSERPDNGRRPPASSLACQNSPVGTDLGSYWLPSGECRSICHRRAQRTEVEQIVDADARDVDANVRRDMRRRREGETGGGTGKDVVLADIVELQVQVLHPQCPVWEEGPLGASARRPAGERRGRRRRRGSERQCNSWAAGPNTRAGVGYRILAPREPASAVNQHVVPGIANAAAQCTE